MKVKKPTAEASRYSVIIQWSDEDHAYVVTLPEWGGCHTHGGTYEEAAKNAREVLELLIEEEHDAGRATCLRRMDLYTQGHLASRMN